MDRIVIWRLRSFAVGVTPDDAVLLELGYGPADAPQSVALRISDAQLEQLANGMLQAYKRAQTRRKKRSN
ncbi:hypothetical protein [Pseudorhodoplanes sp.]|uniref:hypothetical protein n=1 Tax=Pseudorhodoplanes sp. TaxID=1934341 RepID=UPI003D0B1876